MSDNDQPHQALMKAHRERRETDFVPWAFRPCELPLRYTDDGKGHVTCRMAILGMGTLTITVDAPLSKVLKPAYVWERSTVAAKLSAKSMET